MQTIIEIMMILIEIGILLVIFRILQNMDDMSNTTVLGRPKQRSKGSIFKRGKKDQVLSPSKQLEVDQIQRDLDEGYAVDEAENK